MINYAVVLVYSLVAILIVVCGCIVFKHEYKEAKRKQKKRDIYQELIDGVEDMAAQREVVIQKGKSLVKSLNDKNRYKRSEYPDKYSKPLYDEHYLEVQDNTAMWEDGRLGRSFEHAARSTIDADEIDRRLGIVRDKQIKEILGVGDTPLRDVPVKEVCDRLEISYSVAEPQTYKPDCYERSVPDGGSYSSCDNTTYSSSSDSSSSSSYNSSSD